MYLFAPYTRIGTLDFLLLTSSYWPVTLNLSLSTCHSPLVTIILHCTGPMYLIYVAIGAFAPENSQFPFRNLEHLRVIYIFQKKLNCILLSDWISNSSQTPTYKGDPLIWSFLQHIAFTNMPYYITKSMKKALYFTFLMQVHPFNHLSVGVCCCSNVLKF